MNVTESTSRNIRALICSTAICCFVVTPGCREAAPPSGDASPRKMAALIDSPENRRMAAEECVAAYPSAEFGADLTAQAAEIVGREVAEDARAALRRQLTAESFAENRIQILVQTFNVRELTKLAEIYQTAEGKSLMRKLPQHNEAWRSFLKPVILQALGNSTPPDSTAQPQ